MLEHIVRSPAERAHRTPLLFQHGAWHGAWCWDGWLDYFADRGYEVHAISLPGHGQSPLGKGHINYYTLNDYADLLATEVDAISPRPAVIAHSMGAAVAQKLLERQSLPAAVLLAPLPQRGLFPFLLRYLRHHTRDTLTTIATLNTEHIVNSRDKVAARLFSEGADVDLDEWERKLVRESFGVLLSGLVPIADPAKVQGTPILVVAGGKDAVFTLYEGKQTAARYGADFRVFRDQAHNLMAEPRALEVADTIATWLNDQAGIE